MYSFHGFLRGQLNTFAIPLYDIDLESSAIAIDGTMDWNYQQYSGLEIGFGQRVESMHALGSWRRPDHMCHDISLVRGLAGSWLTPDLPRGRSTRV
jgi:hypothetical protein